MTPPKQGGTPAGDAAIAIQRLARLTGGDKHVKFAVSDARASVAEQRAPDPGPEQPSAR